MSEEEQQQMLVENAVLKTQVAQLLEQVAELEAQLAQNSRNSSKPPSSDGFNRPAKNTNRSLRPKTDKKPGGQAGHVGHSLSWKEQPDQIVEHQPSHCSQCQSDLSDQPILHWQSHQVQDLPVELRLLTTEHRSARKQCRHCQHLTQAPFPVQDKHFMQYGPQLRALVVYLCQVQLLPYARTCEVLNELMGLELSQGSVLNILQECYAALEEPEHKIQQALLKAEVIHADETGTRRVPDVEGQRLWLQVVCTAYLTFYSYHKCRGRKSTDEISLLPHFFFKGYCVHDCWASYWTYECLHALCNVHILRELTFVAEHLGQIWAKRLLEFLLELKAQVAQAEAGGQVTLSLLELEGWGLRYRNLIAEGLAVNPPPADGWPKNARDRPKQTKARNLVERLQQHEAQVLAFAHDFRVPFDNNQAERDLQMLKVQQKISGSFRSRAGATYFCRIRGCISTMRKQGESAFKVLHQAFLGSPVIPKLTSV